MRSRKRAAAVGLAWSAVLAAQPVPPEMVRVPASDCPIGATVSHEGAHKARVDEFRMAKYPVTNREYKRFVDATGHRPPERNSLDSQYRLWTGSGFPQEIAGQPVVNVSWTDAQAYCRWLSQETGGTYRLPTEEEWEVAARGGLKGKPYPWGDGIDPNRACYGRKWSGAGTLMDAAYGRPNAYGLYGMAGNVWQWVEDWYVPVFNDRPVQEELHLYRVLRGGSWANDPDFLKVDYRSFHPPEFRDLFVGFRVASK
jgi:formylglycine-generating enzyme required for sulfatase activity